MYPLFILSQYLLITLVHSQESQESVQTALLTIQCLGNTTTRLSADEGLSWTQPWTETIAHSPRQQEIANPTADTIIESTCTCGDESAGGFIATIQYQGLNYGTTNPLKDSYWTLLSSSDGLISPLVYIEINDSEHRIDANLSSNLVSGFASDACWVWNNQTSNTMVFQFDFGVIPEVNSTSIWSETPMNLTSFSPTGSPTGPPTFPLTSISTSSEWTDSPFCDPIRIEIKGFNGLSSHKISNLMLYDDITNLTHCAIFDSASKYGIHSGSFRVGFGSAFGKLSIVETLCVVNKETLTVLSIVLQNERDAINRKFADRLVSLFGTGKESVDVMMTLIVISTTSDNSESEIVETEKSADGTGEHQPKVTTAAAESETMSSDSSDSSHSKLFDLWHGTSLVVMIVFTTGCCVVSVGFACCMLWKSSMLTTPQRIAKMANSNASTPGPTHIPLDSTSLIIAMDPQIPDMTSLNCEESEEDTHEISVIGGDQEHREGDDGHTAQMIDRFLKTP